MTPAHAAASLPWDTVVFLADPFDVTASDRPLDDRIDIEKTDPQTHAEVMAAIEALGLRAVAVETPDALARITEDRARTVVLSTYGGAGSRNRLLLPPALCEAFGFDYVGMDAVGQALSSNKLEAKRLATQCGVLTPRSRVIRDPSALGLCEAFPAPYVLKPLAEGSSIGIGPQNLIRDPAHGRPIAEALLDRFQQPVIIEAFVPGRESSLVCIEGPDGAYDAFVEVFVQGDPGYFDHHLFDAEEKYRRHLPRSVRLIEQGMAPEDREAVGRLLRAVGHFGYCRVDGKFHDGRFHFLELTPDAFLGSQGQLAAGFSSLGWTFVQVIEAILRSATLRPRGPTASD